MKHKKLVGLIAGVCVGATSVMGSVHAEDSMKPNTPMGQPGMMQNMMPPPPMGGQMGQQQGQPGMMNGQQGQSGNMMQGQPGKPMGLMMGGSGQMVPPMNGQKMPPMMGSGMKMPMGGSGMMMPGKPMGPMMGSGQFMGSGMKMPPMMGSGMQQGGVDFLRGYIRTDLTEEEKTALKAVLDAHKAQMEGLKSSMTPGTPPTEEQQAAIKSAQEQLVSAIAPYIIASKLEAFKQSLTMPKPEQMMQGQMMPQGNMQNMMGQGQMNMMGGQMGPNMNGSQPKSKYSLSEKTKTQLAAKLDSIPAEKQVDFFTKLIEKIDTLLSKAKSEKLKTQLSEIQSMVQDKLDALTGGNSEENILNELMN